MSSTVHKKRDHYLEVHRQINSKSKQTKDLKASMEIHQSLQMKFKINNKKIKSLWKYVKKYLEITMKLKKCLAKLKSESNKHENK
jgi:hypothetical protein